MKINSKSLCYKRTGIKPFRIQKLGGGGKVGVANDCGLFCYWCFITDAGQPLVFMLVSVQ